MLPKIKKNISSFIADERGTISKKNLVTGALTIIGLGAIAKKVQAEQGGSPITPGSGKLLPGPGYSQYSCTTQNEIVEGAQLKKTICNAIPSSCGNNHRNVGQAIHTNASWAGHKNKLSMKYEEGKLTGKHAHHGQHANADAECQSSHDNHCQHGNHSKGGWC